jgi:hypothetical protein
LSGWAFPRAGQATQDIPDDFGEQDVPARNPIEDFRLGAPARTSVPTGKTATHFDVGG